ncbi:MAG TPA: tryptophan synthase subunit beta [Myxococcales bacterium LLY-WYZ-16_1]|nr:tryptophan synthase subunit beta [Myxococcales bacterium LLY-WYZ-16_1]
MGHDLNPRFGPWGGAYVPEILTPALDALTEAFVAAQADRRFSSELDEALRTFAGRPTPMYACRRFGDGKIWLKREDLVHGGAHKTNQVIGQALLARRLGKRRLIAETGAGQHGVATAMVGARFGLETRIYMGAVDAARQAPNVERMRAFGAEVVAVESGDRTLRAAIDEAMRDWSRSFQDTHYVIGTVVGPHPFPRIVRTFQRIIGVEARAQCIENDFWPTAVVACVGGGSNAIGIFDAFSEDRVELVGVEAGGAGLETGRHGATLSRGRAGILHGAETVILCDEDGQVTDTHSISAGLDYPGVGPEHAHLRDTERVRYVTVTDEEAVSAFESLAREEGILPALESSHALAHAKKLAEGGADRILVNLSGRGDKDMATVRQFREARQ